MSKIEWTHETLNFVWGCKGKCPYCYAETISKRFASEIARKEALFRTSENPYIKEIGTFEEVYKDLLKDLQNFKPTFLYSQFYNVTFKKNTKLVFLDSMSDVAFWQKDWLIDLIFFINQHPQINFQILTKFPEKIRHIDFPNNVWLGITAENQENFKKRISVLLKIKAGKHFVSLEPLQSAIDIKYFVNVIGCVKIFNEINKTDDYVGKLDWVIAGGQTGHNSKPIHPAWIESLITECELYDIPFFFKSWGNWSPDKPEFVGTFKYVDLNGNQTYTSTKPISAKMYKVGKEAAGRKINGLEYNEFPE